MPARIAIALQDDGWWVRSEVIWHKPNPMPESVTDRPTSAHEKIFLLAKSECYFYDAEAVREVQTKSGLERAKYSRTGHSKDVYGGGFTKCRNPKTDNESRLRELEANGRNLRNVWRDIEDLWTISTKPYKESHFATFPPELAERCIKAGCPKDGTVLDPFAGAGTTLLVADRLGRHGIGIELNPEYAAMAKNRIVRDAPLFAEVAL